MSASHEHPFRPAAYRALLLQPDGAVIDTQVMIVADDDEAILMARAMVDGHAVELWDGLRYINLFETETGS